MIAEALSTWMGMVNDLAGENQMIAGAISLWAMGVATWLLKGVPKAIWGALVKVLTTSMVLNNGGWVESQNLYRFMTWLRPKMSSRFSRTLSLRAGEWNEAALGIGYGAHLFFHDRRLFWVVVKKMDSSGSERVKDEVTIATFGRSHDPFAKLVEEFMPKRSDAKLRLYQVDKHGDWITYSSLPKRPLNTVAAPLHMKRRMVEQIRHFKSSREWFYSRGVPYKLTYVIHGQPGTGKTSLIRAIASEFDLNVCSINIHSLSDMTLERALSTVPENSAVLIEDFDSCAATKNRAHGLVAQGGGSESTLLGDFNPLTLTGVLNALDGVNPLDNCILFLTTNHLEHVDPALYRKGRVDHVIELGPVEPEDARAHAQMLYPDFDMGSVEFDRAIGCQLNEALLEGRDDPVRFLECLGVLKK